MSHSRRGPVGARARLSVDTLEGRDVPAILAAYAVTQDWGSGFQAQVRLSNDGTNSVPFSALSFSLPASISSMWDAKLVSQAGSNYSVTNAGWNTAIPAGGSITFGFVANGPSTASSFVLNGTPLGGSTPPPPVLPATSIADVTINEGNVGTTTAAFTITLSTAATTPVTVKYATVDGTAKAGSDFTAAIGTLTFAPGQTRQTVNVAVVGDTVVEPTETFSMALSAPVGATIARTSALATITNDDTALATSNITYQSVNDWGTGLTGQITVRNPGSTAISNWSVSFDLPGNITSIWSGKILSRVGNRYTVGPESWNGTIPAGGSVAFGFNASPGGIVATNLVLNAPGGSVSPPPPPAANRSPVAVNDAVRTDPGQAAVVSVLANDSDPDRDALTVTAVGSAAHGTATLNPNGTVTYTPTKGYTGTDSFTYALADGRGGTATGTVSVTIAAIAPVQSSWPGRVFAPYVDATLWPTYDFVATARTQGTKFFTLAFITVDPQNKPAWGGYASYGLGSDFDSQMKTNITALRALGGDVAVSFGGASGRELAEMITDVNQLVAAYRSVINAHGLTHIDFDIEGAAVNDKASIDRRSQAIAILKAEASAAGKELNVRFTLPVLPTGLTADGLYVLQSAKNAGFRPDLVNVMAMDYGDSAAPSPNGKMGDYAIQAGNSLFTQLTQVFGAVTSESQRWAMVGLTPMIGMNDVQTEIFDQQEAREVVAWAQTHNIGLLSMWSLNRDKQSASGKLNYVDLNSSSLLQSPLEFSDIFNVYTG